MRHYDVIVVGAGPAGCAAAYDLATAGRSVLLIEQKRFARLKPCAGALTIKAVKRLRYSIAPVITYVVRDLEAHFSAAPRRLFKSDDPIAVMTVRREFDAYCLVQTLRKGVAFQPEDTVASLVADTDSVSVTTARGDHLQCRYLIGADGANSRVRRLIGEDAPAQALALEANIAHDGCARPAMRFDFGYVLGGYGWVFHKGDHLNIGLYTQRAGIRLSKTGLQAYARKIGGQARLNGMVGYPVAVGGERYAQRHPRVFLAGDAAGMTERLLGEGIHNALATGQAAARAIIGAFKDNVATTSAQYCADLMAVQRDLEACRAAARWFYDLRFLGLARWFPLPRRKALMRGYAAGMPFRQIMRSWLSAASLQVEPVQAVLEYEATPRRGRISLPMGENGEAERCFAIARDGSHAHVAVPNRGDFAG